MRTKYKSVVGALILHKKKINLKCVTVCLVGVGIFWYLAIQIDSWGDPNVNRFPPHPYFIVCGFS